MLKLIFKIMKVFSLHYVSWKIVPFWNYSNKQRIFVTIESCAFNIQFEGVIRPCRPNFWEFKEIIKIQMIVSKDELVARPYSDGHFNNLPIQANKE